LAATPNARIFLSHAGEDAFEASLLQFAVERIPAHFGATVRSYRRDQPRHERDVAGGRKTQVRQSDAVIFLLSPSSLDMSLTQWMELAYADAFDIPVFILLTPASREVCRPGSANAGCATPGARLPVQRRGA
jgi:nucleoside 2-deoxyribosyltransferase